MFRFTLKDKIKAYLNDDAGGFVYFFALKKTPCWQELTRLYGRPAATELVDRLPEVCLCLTEIPCVFVCMKLSSRCFPETAVPWPSAALNSLCAGWELVAASARE